MTAEAPTQLKIGDYDLVRAVGQGGMAQVWLARRTLEVGATKACALKVPLKHLATDERFVRMFLTEARLAMRLSHSNIVGTFDAGQDGDLLYLAMEWVDGVDLAKLQQTMRRASVRWSLSVAAHMLGELLHALAYAHTFTIGAEPQGIVHRDVSPHNLLISASGEVKLTDFGIARMGGEETSHEHAKGKLRYMAAEQLRGHATQSSDLFAAGAIFHELLTGEKFRDGCRGEAFYGAILNGTVPALTRPEIPEPLRWLHDQLLQPDPANRIESAEAALGYLAQWDGYRSERIALRKLVQRHTGADRRASGLTGCVPWTAEMAETLQVIETHQAAQARVRSGAAASKPSSPRPATAPYVVAPSSPPGRSGGASAPPTPAYCRGTEFLAVGDAATGTSMPAVALSARGATVLVRPAFIDAADPTTTAVPRRAETTWTGEPAAAGAARRPVRWFAAFVAVGLTVGAAGGGTAWWLAAEHRDAGAAPVASAGASGKGLGEGTERTTVTDGGPSVAASRGTGPLIDVVPARDAEPAVALEVDAVAVAGSDRAVRAETTEASTARRGRRTHVDTPARDRPRAAKRGGRRGEPETPAGQGPKPPPAAPPVAVLVMLDFVDEAEVTVGRVRRIVSGSVRFEVPSGRQQVRWRVPGTKNWIVNRTIDLGVDRDHLLRIRPREIRHQAVAKR